MARRQPAKTVDLDSHREPSTTATGGADPAGLTPKQAARRDRIIHEAMALAAEGGYEAVQMRDVAARAKVALGTLYRYFSSKDNLLLAAHAEWTRELQQRIDDRPPKGDTAAERVVAILRRGVRAFERNPKLAEALVTAMLSSDEATRASRVEGRRIWTQMLSQAMDGPEPSEQQEIIWLLGQVWFANLVTWVSGITDTTQMAEDLERAARILLRHV